MRIEQLHEIFLESSGLCTDSRKIEPGCLFFALRGEHFNGNEYADEALEKGAIRAVIDDMRYHRNSGETIFYGNALKLLQKLATFHRRQLGIPIVALTGSNGKTTTKELITAVLSKKFRTTATKGNLNNHIGVPITLLSMDHQTEIGVVEMGANHQKEIELLSSIALPDYGLITNFGKAHLEGFGGVEGVIKGKSELYRHLKADKKTAFVNGNDPKQLELTKGIHRIVFGPQESSCPVELESSKGTLRILYQGRTIHTQLIGEYNFGNVAAAIAIGQHFKVAPDDIKSAIEEYTPANNRSQLLKKNGFEIVLDAYNANPSSMMAAIRTFEQQTANSKYLILGDMFELGDDAASEHQAITDYLAQNKGWTAFLIGENFARTQTTAPHLHLFERFEDFKDYWKRENIRSGSLLLKGSRGMAMERALDLL